MIVAVDSSVLLYLIDPDVPAPRAVDGSLPDRCKERVDYLIDQMSKAGDRLLVPTPVLAEVLVRSGSAGPDWLNTLRGRKAVRVAPFDERAAVECAEQTRLRAARTRSSPRAKAKFDEQIVAIAIVERAEMILSDDPDIRSLAPPSIVVRGIADLDLPPSAAQPDMFGDPE